MKRLFYACISVFTFGNMLSQPITTKDGLPVLPQRGDWSIGIDATRLLKLDGFNFVSGSNAIMGRYMRDSLNAYRFGVRLGFHNNVSKAFVEDRLAASNPTQTFPAAVPRRENVWRRTSTLIGLSYGIEKRRGLTRLQGIYGIEGSVFLSASRDKFTYANKLNTSPTTPVSVDARNDAMFSPQLGSANNVDTVPQIQAVKGYARVVDRRNGLALSIGARAFIGAEYFFLPKMSVGGEFGWGIAYTTTGRSVTIYESEGDQSSQGIRNTTIDGGVNNSFSIDNDNNNYIGGLSASLRLSLYF